MIKANELRIGNWLSVNEDGPDVNKQIVYIGKDCKGFDGYFLNFGAMSVSLEGREDNVTPIPLTPEILENYGFIKDGFGAYNIAVKNNYQTSKGILSFSGDYLYLRHENDNNKSNDSICTLWNKDLMKEFYVHDLQNLYFALTGEELKITL